MFTQFRALRAQVLDSIGASWSFGWPTVEIGRACPSACQIEYDWPLARAACGLEHVRLHDIRHTMASEIIAAGGDPGDVGAVLNHKSAASSKRNAHWLLQRKHAALVSLGRKAA